MLRIQGPNGFRLVHDVIDPAEEAALVALGEELAFEPYVMRGQASLRRVAFFGAGYGSSRPDAPPIPSALLPVRDRLARIAALPPEGFVGALYTRYPPGAGIGWHRDFAVFGPTVLGLSLGATCRFRMRRPDALRETWETELPPRSLYVLSDEARRDWEHMIPAVRARRCSITFRTLRG